MIDNGVYYIELKNLGLDGTLIPPNIMKSLSFKLKRRGLRPKSVIYACHGSTGALNSETHNEPTDRTFLLHRYSPIDFSWFLNLNIGLKHI